MMRLVRFLTFLSVATMASSSANDTVSSNSGEALLSLPTGTLAWTESDLWVARRYTKGVTRNLSDQARKLIHERSSMLVAVTPSDQWLVRYQDFSIEVHKGESGDFETFSEIVENKQFLIYRCTRLRSFKNAPVLRDCGWPDLVERTQSVFENEEERVRYLEVAGEAINGLPANQRRQLLASTQVSDWAASAITRHRQAEQERLLMARNVSGLPPVSPEAWEVLVNQINVVGMTESTTLYADEISDDASVMRADLGDAQIYVSASTEGGKLPDDIRNSGFSLSEIRSLWEQDAIGLAVGIEGEPEVQRLNAREIDGMQAHLKNDNPNIFQL